MTTDVAPAPRLVAWEVTRRCNLACVHCRAAAGDRPYPDELTFEEGKRLLDEVASLGRPIMILTGGEPLLREDLVDLVRHGTARGLAVALATNGTLLTSPIAEALREAGLRRVSVSLDAATGERHDAFRGVPGAYAGAMAGIAVLREADLPFQVNSTLSKATIDQKEALLALALREGAVAWHVFLLVEVGRGRRIADDQLSPAEYEEALEWLADQRDATPISIKVTCAPQFQRIIRQRLTGKSNLPGRQAAGLGPVVAQPPSAVVPGRQAAGLGSSHSSPLTGHSSLVTRHSSRGCLAGTGFCFVSYRGIVSPCGYLELDCGDVRREGLARAWRESPVLRDLREVSKLKGKCRACDYRAWCGGCRARAYARTGDYLAEEPCCTYVPGG